jgi:gliding motility-associated-like protein
MFKQIKYYSFTCAAVFVTVVAAAQIGRAPLFNISFGQAASDDLSLPGPALNFGFTSFPYTASVCPAPGYYSTVTGISPSCNYQWIPLFSDNTPYPDNNGYMMLLHDTASSVPRTIFQDRVTEICENVDYQFSAAIINTDKPSSGCVRFSSLTLRVEDNLGRLIASTSTGDIQFAVYNQGYHFNGYAVNFRLPPGAAGIVVKLINSAKSIATNCTNTIAIDDIKVVVTGAKVDIRFDSMAIGEWVKNTCFQNNSFIRMYGTVDSGIVNPAVQWQQSKDKGTSWADIPGATGYSYGRNFPVIGTFFFRLRIADSSRIANPNCGISSDILQVAVSGPPEDIAVTSNSPVCAGQDLIFNASGGSAYTWRGPNGFHDNVYYAHIFHSTLADSGTYYVTVSTPGGCSATDSIRVKVNGTDVRIFPADTAICTGKSLQLNATPGAVSYSWSPSVGLSATHVTNPVATPGSNTIYTVKLTDKDGCTGEATSRIHFVNTVPIKAVIAGTETLCRTYDSASFSSAGTGHIVQWEWDFGNGYTGTSSKPPVQYYSPAGNQVKYTVQLIVADSAACTDTSYHIIKVESNCFIAVPTAFTPNGDGNNDYLYPLNAYKATNLLFRVYNRNGQLVFETRDRANKWNGTVKGQAQPVGAYIWILRYTDAAGKKIELKGSSVLLR